MRARNGAVQVPWLEGAVVLNPDQLPPTHANPQAHFPKYTATMRVSFQEFYIHMSFISNPVLMQVHIFGQSLSTGPMPGS